MDRWTPNEDWIRRWTERVWDVAFDGDTLRLARAKRIPLREGADRFRTMLPTVEVADRLQFDWIACAFGSSMSASRAWTGLFGIRWSLDQMTRPTPGLWPDTPAGWLMIVCHEVAHHLSPPTRTRGRGKRDVHGKHFRLAEELLTTRLLGYTLEELGSIAPAPRGRETTYAHDRRVQLLIEHAYAGVDERLAA